MKKFVLLAGTIPVFNNKVLLIQRSLKSKFLPGAWGMPAGKVDFGEDIEQTALRELKEETNLDGTIRHIIGTLKFTGIKEGIFLHNVQVNYIIDVSSDKVKIDSSSNDFKWVKVDEVLNSEIDDFNKRVFQQAMDYLK